RSFRPDRFQQFNPVGAAFQADIDDGQIKVVVSHSLKRIFVIAGLHAHLDIWFFIKQLYHAFAEKWMIIHDHHAAFLRRRFGFLFHELLSGIRQVTVVPHPCLESISSDPPETFARYCIKWMPNPVVLSFFGMAWPSSRTESTTSPFRGCNLISIAPGCACF